ncbi:MAG: TonB-dependent receptor [Proteobacteria bacterium]|nr:TonB-dependent receptor [Pseudomonadota bacterium]
MTRNLPALRRHAVAAAICAAFSGPALADGATQQLATVTINGNYDTGVGTSDAASEGSVTAKLIEYRPTLRPAEVLEFVPGIIVTQHSGDGKANQYFLRGFNLDHGTDFATDVDGMPVNMPTHAHGQGYSDLNWLIPELVNRIDFRKGPYYADEGDFASAGAAHIRLADTLPRGIASLTVGEHEYERALVAKSRPFGDGNLLYALEAAHNNGPWDYPEKFHRLNGVLRYSFGDAANRSSITAMAYSAGWNSTDQIPQYAVQAGLIDRFGAIDPTDGGQTARYSLSFNTERQYADGTFRFNAYAIRSRLDLFSDFTYNLDNPTPSAPVNADQFEQAEHRQVFGLATSRSFDLKLGGYDGTTTVGLQARQDRLDPVGLYSSVGRQRVGTTQEATVRETSVGVYVQNATQWTPWLRSIAGLRYDQYDFDVSSSIPENSGKKNAGIASPKLSLILGPWNKTEYFVNYGWGFHSNDARGVTETITPKERGPGDPSPPLVRTKGGELGLRTELVPGLQTSLALWQLDLGSELVFSGDAGDTEPSGASKRYGIEFNNHYVVNSWLLLDADLAWSRASFNQFQTDVTLDGVEHGGRYIPGSVATVASLGATVTDYGPWFGQFQLRYFGPRALIEDDSQRSNATTLGYLRVGYRITPDLKVALDVFNLFDSKASDIDYYYTSRLPGRPAQDGIHFHPVEPRSLRLTLTANF